MPSGLAAAGTGRSDRRARPPQADGCRARASSPVGWPVTLAVALLTGATVDTRAGELRLMPRRPSARGPGPVPVTLRSGIVQGHLVPAELRRNVNVGHADLIAVVEHGGTGQGGEDQQGEPHLPLVAAAPAAREPAHVVIGAGPHRAGGLRQGAERRRHGPGQLRAESGEDKRETNASWSLVVPVVIGEPVEVGPRSRRAAAWRWVLDELAPVPNTPCVSGRLALYWPAGRTARSAGSPPAAAGCPELRSLHARLRHVDAKPATPRSNQNRGSPGTRVTAFSPVQVRLAEQEVVQGYWPLRSSRVHAHRPSHPASCRAARRRRPGQPRRNSPGIRCPAHPAATNWCAELVWLGTRSSSTRRPRHFLSAISRSRSASVPSSG